MSASLLDAKAERGRESFATAGKPRHHRTDWNADHVADLLVAQLLDLAEHGHFAELVGQRIKRAAERRALRPLDSARIGLARIGERQSSRVEGHGVPRAAMLAKPGHAAIPHDRQQPRPCVALTKALEIANRAEHGILNHVLRVVLVTHEIACERVRIVEMRQHDSLEAIDVALGHGLKETFEEAGLFPAVGGGRWAVGGAFHRPSPIVSLRPRRPAARSRPLLWAPAPAWARPPSSFRAARSRA